MQEPKFNLIPYASHIGSPKIEPVDTSHFINKSLQKFNHHSETKFNELKKEFEEKNTPKRFVVIEQDFRRMANGVGRTTIIFSSDDEKQCHEMCRVQNELYEKSKIHGVVLLTYMLDKPDDHEV